MIVKPVEEGQPTPDGAGMLITKYTEFFESDGVAWMPRNVGTWSLE